MNWIEQPKVAQFLDWFEQSPPRERQLTELTLQVALVFGFFLILEPLWNNTLSNSQKLQQAENQLSQLEQQMDLLKGIKPKDTNRILGQQIYDLMDQSVRLEETTAESVAQLVSPELMVGLLGELLADVEGVELLELRNLDPAPVYANAEGKLDLQFKVGGDAGEQAPASGGQEVYPARSESSAKDGNPGSTPEPILWRHSLTMKFKATYPGMLQYLEQLQALPGQLFWQSMEYQQTEYPWGEVQLEVFTLSQTKEALSV